jgi:penicillin-binding protein 1A
MTRVYAADGQVMAEYAVERRIYIPIDMIPDWVEAAFVSAEDAAFFRHEGLDYLAVVRAALSNLQWSLTGVGRLSGGSTITQQLVKNLFLTSDRTWQRKIEEAILALSLERELSKEQILELYLNEIYLGMGSHGIAVAALTYFGKEVQYLSIAEAAYLAALARAPANYDPIRHPEAALERRNWVIDRMVATGHITSDEGEAAKAEPLGVTLPVERPRVFAADRLEARYAAFVEQAYPDQTAVIGGVPTAIAAHFYEEVRRRLVAELGADQVYAGGLYVRTSLDPNLQIVGRKVLIDALVAFDEAQGWRGPVANVSVDADWPIVLREIDNRIEDVFEWHAAIVLALDNGEATIAAYRGDETGIVAGTIPPSELEWANEIPLTAGDVVYVERVGDDIYRLRQNPEIDGALVAMEPQSGRVLALVGGFSFSESEFNRATQAMRQPGSSFKPFVYAAALENGYSPSSVVLDAPIAVPDLANRTVWRPSNYGGRYYGRTTLRTGLERSLNVLTVRLSQEIGMDQVVDYAVRFGIYDQLAPHPPMAIGAGETTLLRLTAGYAAIANGGRRVTPTLIDLVQDQSGNTILAQDQQACEGCDMDWGAHDEPQLIPLGDQVVSPQTAYLLTSMLEGVVQRGTATVVRQLGHPIAGKTGTTNDFRDAWFVGYSAGLVVGLFLGYDIPQSMGNGVTGGALAAPVFTDFMSVVLADQPAVPLSVNFGGTPEPATHVVDAVALNLRAEPSASSPIIRSYPRGTTVTAMDQRGNWMNVTLDGGEVGWMNQRYLVEAPRREQVVPVADPFSPTHSVVALALNLRSGPSAGSPVIRAYPQETTVMARQFDGNWLQVQLEDGVTGWMNRRFLSAVPAE